MSEYSDALRNLGGMALERAASYVEMTEIWRHIATTRTFPLWNSETGELECGDPIKRETVWLEALKRLESTGIPEKAAEKTLDLDGGEVRRLEVRFILDAKMDDARVSSEEMGVLEGEFKLLGGV